MLTEKWKLYLLLTSSSLATISWVSSTFSFLPSSTGNLLGMLAAALGVVFIAHSAARSLMEGVFGIDVLATVAVLASIVVGEYVAAAVVVLMLGGGEFLEDYAFRRASRAIQNLMEAKPRTAIVIKNGEEVEIPVEKVELSETVIVKPGGLIPVDGVVLKGTASVNQASVTGESMPVERSEGSEVYSGSIIELGSLEIRATAVGEDSTYGRIIRMVQEAEEHRASIERVADRYARYFTPLILTLGVAVYILTRDILRTAALFVIACPCSLTLATPTAIVASIGNGARKGILIRNGESLEKLSSIDILALDKTGTITTGHPEVVEVKGFGHTESEVLRLAATAERRSEHPLARAVLRYAGERGLAPEEWREFEVHPGLGVRVESMDDSVTVGNEKMLAKYSIPLNKEARQYQIGQKLENTTVFVARGEEVIGVIRVQDTLRANARKAIESAKLIGLKKTVMLTGDNEYIAKMIGESIGVDEVAYGLMPSEKVDYIKKMKAEGFKVAMIGDGINDAPALASSDVGIAMGLSGTDVAMETAGVTLSTDDLERVPTLLKISRETIKVIKQNLAFAMALNILGIVLTVYGVVPPLVAAVIHESNALAVMLNSIKLLKVS